MKRIDALFAAVMLAASMWAYDFTALDTNGNTIYYTKIGGDSVEVSNNGNTGTYSGNIVIPDLVTNDASIYRVTTIGANAFKSCTLASLVLPEGIQEIKSGAFNSGNIHAALNLPNLKKLGYSAFYGCKYVTKILMPNLQQIAEGNRTFTDCYDLAEVEFPEQLEKTNTLSNLLFDSNILLRGIKLPANLKSVPDGCFRACWSLKYAILPDSAESIGANAFLGCVSLKYITIPAKVQSIGDSFICGHAMDWMRGSPTDTERISNGGVMYGGYPGQSSTNQLNSIYFEGLTPPQVTTKTFANITKDKVTCYVPAEALDAYLAEEAYVNAFAAIKGYHIGESQVDEVTSNSVRIQWLSDPDVVQYTISIYTSGTLWAQYIVDGNGQVTDTVVQPSALIARMPKKKLDSEETFTISIGGLTVNTTYSYFIEGTDEQQQTIYHEEGHFQTADMDEGLFDFIATEQERVKKTIIDGKMVILRGDHVFDIQGKMVK